MSARATVDAGRRRAVAVDARGILAALRDVYGATALADEITGSK